MTENNPVDATPPVIEDPKQDPGTVISSIPESQIVSPNVTVPITVAELPIEHKETFWEIAKTDVEEAYRWLVAEIRKI